MDDQLRICRVCREGEGDGELVPVYEKNNKIAIGIYVLSGVKIFSSELNREPPLICVICIKQLSKAIKFRNKCRESDSFFKKTILDFLIDSKAVKEENVHEDEKEIKGEPEDEFSLIDDTVHESNNFTDFCVQTKAEFSSSDSSGSFTDFEEYRRKRKLKKKSAEFRNYELGFTEETAQCNLCFKTFTSVHSLKDHMRAIHQKLEMNDMFKCPQCERLFKMKYYLNRHIKSFHLKEDIKKGKRLKGKQRIEGDEIFKEKLVGLNCPYCNKFLTSKHSLSDHIRVRHEFISYSERFLCDICGKDFPLKYYLLRHIRASHLKTLSYKKKIEDHLPCSICGKILKSKGNLSTHEKTHRILSPHEYWYCDICGNKFKGRGEMTVHIKKRHLYKIRYPCEICPNKSWRTLFQLQRHVKVFHHNIREFKCEWCGKEFGEKNKLVCHVRIHTGEQPFKCNFTGCSRAFTHQTDLRRHVWGHTGERPYKCQNQSCLKGFMKKSELTAHESRCHPAVRPNLPLSFQYQMM